MWFGKKKKEEAEEDILYCPRCDIAMEKVKKHDVIIDVCDKCNGMWLDDNEIEKLVAIGKQSTPKKKASK